MRAVSRALPFLLLSVASAAERPLSFADIIEQQEPLSPRLSPDGSTVAFLVRRSSTGKNASASSLWAAAPGSAPRMLLDENAGLVEWIPEGGALSATLPRPGNVALWRIPADGKAPKPLFDHPTRISSYAWSPDGARLLFVTAEAPSSAERERINRQGIVYDETVHGIRSFTQRNWVAAGAQQVWLWRKGEKQAQRVVVDLSAARRIGRYSWSRDGRHIAVEYVPRDEPGLNLINHIGVLTCDPETGMPSSFTPRVTAGVANRNPQWHPRAATLVFASTGDAERFYSPRSALQLLSLDQHEPVRVPLEGDWFFLPGATWDAAGDNLLVEYDDRSRSTLYRVPVTGGKPRAIVAGTAHYSDFHFSRDKALAACIRQTFTEPPEIALVDLKTGTDTRLTSLNPQFRSISLQPAEERRWRNRHGHETNGFLMLPPRLTRGRRLPLLVIQYHFSNKFTTQAQWMTSYPAQHFAQAGFAVLLLNYPRELGWTPGDFEAAALSQAYNPLASIEAAVQSLIDEGIVDPKRKGMLGWSFGGWLVEMAITQSDLFEAASAGESGLNNAGQYWVTGSAGMQRYLDAFFGGPPWGEAYRNYQRLAPALNAHRVKIPLLREYGTDVGVQSLEFYMALRRLGKPVEQIIYPGAPHVFDLPSHRGASMERNLDWFRFWLQGYEDPAEHKRDQYRRWRSLQKR